MTTDYEFRTVDFRPALSGWRIAYATPDGPQIEPMPGWLIREEVEYDTHTGDVTARTGSRQVVAAHLVGSEAEPAHGHAEFWCVLGPGQSEPTEAEAAEEITRRYAAGSKVLPLRRTEPASSAAAA